MYALIMAGGIGSRLWPRSRHDLPKQFLPLLTAETMVQATAARVEPLIGMRQILVATGREYVETVVAQLPQLPLGNIIGEPSGKGTAPCIGLGAIDLHRRDPDATMAVLSADHLILKAHAFREALRAAEEVAQRGYLVTLGIKPEAAHTGYGYIKRGDQLGTFHGYGAFVVDRFVEKPDQATAEQYLADGGYSWNAGIFVWRVDQILDAIAVHLPELRTQLDALAAAGAPGLPDAFGEVWSDVASITIDHGIMEHATRVAVIPVDIGWSDVGDWDTLAHLAESDAAGNVHQADHVSIDTSGTFVYSDSDRLIATIGAEDLIIVDTRDALMIIPRRRAQDIKRLLSAIREHGRTDLL